MNTGPNVVVATAKGNRRADAGVSAPVANNEVGEAPVCSGC